MKSTVTNSESASAGQRSIAATPSANSTAHCSVHPAWKRARRLAKSSSGSSRAVTGPWRENRMRASRLFGKQTASLIAMTTTTQKAAL